MQGLTKPLWLVDTLPSVEWQFNPAMRALMKSDSVDEGWRREAEDHSSLYRKPRRKAWPWSSRAYVL